MAGVATDGTTTHDEERTLDYRQNDSEVRKTIVRTIAEGHRLVSHRSAVGDTP
ncbi:hypothetical protein NRB56_29030 [Nocardia sp. RB56]|uniref:Uncharacterized protein n=1 Tax=Nocardia aurantia TaxID=2585199 RepID=A0A7K0DNK2_9NOCA|nr:hypothetical protein [Nocardia aurantia]